MNDDAAFLAAIADAPDDSAPRLVYADYGGRQGGEGEAMNDERLAELERLCEVAQPGPWEVRDSDRHPAFFTCPSGIRDWPEGGLSWSILADGGDPSPAVNGWAVLFGESGGDSGGIVPTHADLDFVAAARTAVPELVAEVRRLRTAIDAAVAAAREEDARIAEKHVMRFNGMQIAAEIRARAGRLT
jgi:uncharacterized protein (TIGR02996 family)